MKNKITSLLEVRKLMALLVITLFVILSVMGTLETAFIQNLILSIVSFYFGKTTAVNEKG